MEKDFHWRSNLTYSFIVEHCICNKSGSKVENPIMCFRILYDDQTFEYKPGTATLCYNHNHLVLTHPSMTKWRQISTTNFWFQWSLFFVVWWKVIIGLDYGLAPKWRAPSHYLNNGELVPGRIYEAQWWDEFKILIIAGFSSLCIMLPWNL